MSTKPICPCDATTTPEPTNLPGLPQISFRVGDFNSFRTALLTPLVSPPGQPPAEVSLTAWNSGRGIDSDPSVIDLAVMMVEWFAYLADILTFYNERIANEDYLHTAVQPARPAALVNLLGYRSRPTIGATGYLAALLSPSVVGAQTITLPDGLEFQSKPGPGSTPQSFELHPATTIGLPARVAATPPPTLLGYPVSGGYNILLNGAVSSVSNGAQLLLGPRDNTAAPNLIAVSAVPAVQTTATGKQTAVNFSITQSGATLTNAASSRLLKPNQNAGLWTVNQPAGDPVIDSTGTVIQMAGLLRQVQPGDWLVFTAPGVPSQAVQVASTLDVLGDAGTSGGPSTVSPNAAPIPVLHTRLTLKSALSGGLVAAASSISVQFGWVEAAVLVDQPTPAWPGSPKLQPIQPAQFPAVGSRTILLADTAGNGAQASGTVASDGTLAINWPTTTTLPLSPALVPPVTVYYDLLPVSAGKTVTNEIVGSGDSTQPGQSFTLSKSPVTYLASGSTYASTIALTVNGLPWTEVQSFYNQPANAQVFVSRQDANQMTHLDFGDGVNGALLPTGTNNIVATYRYGGGSSSPPAGKLTVVAKSYPGLQSVVNPVAVAGGSDPDPAALLKQYAPRSVLTFGRAVSVFDYEAIAAGAPGVSMASAVWTWDAANQRAGVAVYVAGQAGVAASVQTLLTASGDPNRPVTVLTATEVPVTLTLQLIVLAGADTSQIEANVTTALCDSATGLFSPPQIAIGHALFDSNIEAVLQSVPGVIAVASSTFAFAGADPDPGSLHNPGEGCYFSLTASTGLILSTETP